MDPRHSGNPGRQHTSRKYLCTSRTFKAILIGLVTISCFLWFLAVVVIPGPSRISSELGRPRSGLAKEDQLTIILNTFKRLDLLRTSVAHYSQCGIVRRIHVNWAESRIPPDLDNVTCCRTPLSFGLPLLSHNDSSLNTRFLPVPDLETEAVLNIDDDIIVSCGALERAFEVWRGEPEQLAGWFPRDILCSPSIPRGARRYTGKSATLLRHAHYNTILTKGAIMHARYLSAYWDDAAVPAMADVRQMVAKQRNCEDIAMQFLISYLASSAAAPSFVWEPWLYDAGESGGGVRKAAKRISDLPHHMKHRTACVDALLKHFPPLQGRALSSQAHSTLLRLSPVLDAVARWLSPAPQIQTHCVCALV